MTRREFVNRLARCDTDLRREATDSREARIAREAARESNQRRVVVR